MTYSNAARYTVPPSAYSVLPARAPVDVARSMMHPSSQPLTRYMDMSSSYRAVAPLDIDMSSGFRPVASPRVSSKPTATVVGTVSAAAPRATRPVQMMSGLSGGGGHGGGGHGGHGGGHHGGHHGGHGGGWGRRGRGFRGGYGFGPGYWGPWYDDYYVLPSYTELSSMELALDDLGRLLAAEPGVVSVAEADGKIRIEVASPLAARRVRARVPEIVRGIRTVIAHQPPSPLSGGMFTENLFSGSMEGASDIAGLGATMGVVATGSGDPRVRALQTHLVRMGALDVPIGGPPTTIDGMWGPLTENALGKAAAMVGYSGARFTRTGSTVTVPDELMALITSWEQTPRTVEPGAELPVPGTIPSGVTTATAGSKPWGKYALIGGGVLAAVGAVAYFATRKRVVNNKRRRCR